MPGRAGTSTRGTPSSRALRSLFDVLPYYAGFTLVLWVLLLLGGDPGLIALSRAMGTISTSGISPVSGATSTSRRKRRTSTAMRF